MTLPELRRGDVWLARLDKLRPVIVLTRDPVAAMLNTVVVVPVTSRARGLSTEVEVGPGDGFRRLSVANTDNTTSVNTETLTRRVSRLRPSTMTAICEALATAINCENQ